MKIVNIVPGFGGTFYCGNCLRDSVLVRTLRKAGHDSITMPIYLPLSAKSNQDQADTPVFYGAVSIFLKQNYKFLRHMPSWLERLLDSKPMLRFAASKAGSTRPDGLEEMTISMLQGSDGYQKEELQQLIDFLRYHEKPDVVHLSDALLLGLAEKIKNEVGARVVCSLQDEDMWVEPMKQNYREKVWNLMAEKAKDVDAFIAVSDYFAGFMKGKMRIADAKMHTVSIGIDPHNYKVFEPSLNPPTIGFLSRLSQENGLGLVVDAFTLLKQNPGFKNARLRFTGGMTGDDRRFFNAQMNKLKRHGVIHDVQWMQEFDAASLPAFFNGLSVLSVPVLAGEAFGLYQLESMASGIPVIQPSIGAFPEIIRRTGGGTLFQPNTPEALSSKYAEVLSQPELLRQMGRNGRAAIEKDFNNQSLMEQTLRIYQQILS